MDLDLIKQHDLAWVQYLASVLDNRIRSRFAVSQVALDLRGFCWAETLLWQVANCCFLEERKRQREQQREPSPPTPVAVLFQCPGCSPPERQLTPVTHVTPASPNTSWSITTLHELAVLFWVYGTLPLFSVLLLPSRTQYSATECCDNFDSHDTMTNNI